MDKTSYAIGLSFGQHLAESGIKGIDYNSFARGVEAMCEKKPLEIDIQEAQQLLNTYFTKLQAEQEVASADKRKAGEEFLKENAKREGVITLKSGLQYEIMVEGNGVIPTAKDKVKVHYHGTLIDGSVFDSSVQRGEPAVFGVTQVIQGWVEALQLMPVGSKWKLFIPYNLAYGERGAGSMIQPYSALIFEVELLDIVK
ncbi:MAG: FKBP-type peptidyl-prolyl cis-trans isomerase [Bacteroidales bacterium]|nr:FKBP-type peptidyl-prolyl cis-trans isomerase [Bacteroidales bacterium]MDD5974566.1 FKBP-type peptidyl-prolyl cis-trans isomerase [Bacteroidales bacterium]